MKKKKIDTVSAHDKLQALKTIPQFIADLEDIRNTKGYSKVHKGRAFEKKYGFSPADVDHPLTEADIRAGYADEKYLKDPSLQFEPLAVEILSFCERKILSETMENGIPTIEIGYDEEPYIQYGRYATLRIDMMKSKPDLMREIAEAINLLKERVSRPKSNPPLREIKDIWRVYSMRTDPPGMDFSAITRVLFPEVKELLSRDPSFINKRKPVVAAYNKAAAIIKQVAESIKTP